MPRHRRTDASFERGGGSSLRSRRRAGRRTRPRSERAAGPAKVPAVATVFWVVKILTTGMGETASDFLARALGPVVAGGLGAAGLVLLLWLQFRAARYRAWTYWAAIVMVSVFGTMAADVVHVVAGVPYTVSAAAFALMLAAILMSWYASEGTLSIHTVRTRRREYFYWATVLATFALGTAVGDLSASTLHLGYLPAGLLFAALILLPALAHRYLGLNAVVAFWWAYILTRPLGASFADWMGVGTGRGGLGWGTGPVSLALAVPIAALITWLAVSRADEPEPEQGLAAERVGRGAPERE
ncbi:COG4705 family protein [Streptomyces sp. 8L]|uniref:COG4705 family protein n=1 Tax=Streptomyces sp. 8L TaxID=2877242 RepID=UPI0035A8DE1E